MFEYIFCTFIIYTIRNYYSLCGEKTEYEG